MISLIHVRLFNIIVLFNKNNYYWKWLTNKTRLAIILTFSVPNGYQENEKYRWNKQWVTQRRIYNCTIVQSFKCFQFKCNPKTQITSIIISEWIYFYVWYPARLIIKINTNMPEYFCKRKTGCYIAVAMFVVVHVCKYYYHIIWQFINTIKLIFITLVLVVILNSSFLGSFENEISTKIINKLLKSQNWAIIASLSLYIRHWKKYISIWKLNIFG